MSDNLGDQPAAPQNPANSAPPAPPVPPVPPVPPLPNYADYQPRPQYGAYAPGYPASAHANAGQPQPTLPVPHAGPTHPTQQPTQPTQPTLPLQGAQPTGPTTPLNAFGAPVTASVETAPKSTKSGGSAVAKFVGVLAAAAIVGGVAGVGGAWAGNSLFAPVGATPAAGPQTVTVNNPESVNQTAAIAAKVVPSVVTISAEGQNSGGTGSGVVLTKDGYIATNTHVVTLDGQTGSAKIRVTTSDGRVLDAEVIGTDPIYDLAVIKVDADDLTPITFGDSSRLNVGEPTVAIGAPLGLSNTVTTGIVSALNRSIEIASSAAPEGQDEDEQGQGQEDSPFFFDFGQGQQQQNSQAASISIGVIQTDAAINPGNSGGALVNGEGHLIGINVAIATAGGGSGESGSIGVGFSIPSNVVKRVTDEIIENGSATHGLLGAKVQSAAYVDGVSITGAYIAEATAGGAAAAAGLRDGDIVIEFNGLPITDSVDLTAQVRALAAGSTAKLTYVRDGETRTAEVTLGSLSQ